MLKNQQLLKLVSLYLIYFIYTYMAGILIQHFSNVSEPLVMLFVDFIFLIFILFIFRKKLEEDWKLLKKDYTLSKIFRIILFGMISIFVLNITMGAITDLLLNGVDLDQNTQAIKELASISMLYTVFKTMIFGIIAEELLFREALNDCVKNDLLFVILSSIIYTLMNFIFTSTQSTNLFVDLMIYFIPALLFSFIYIKNKRNILFVMFIKFAYNLIPLIILIAGTLA